MKLKRFCFIALITLASASAIASQKLDGIAAVVNDEIITIVDWNKQYAQVRRDLVRSQVDLPPAQKLKSQVLQHMVEVQLQVQEAKKYGVEVTDKAVADAVNNIAKQNNMRLADLKQKLVQEGFDYGTYQKNIRQQMLMSEIQKKLIASKIKITPQQIENEYNYALTKQDAANEFHLKNILIPVSDAPTSREMVKAKQRAMKAYQKLSQGKSFDTVALAESGDSTALEGGDLGWRTVNALPEVFIKHVKTMKVGSVSKPISTPNGFHIIKLVDKRSAIKPHYTTQAHVRHILLRVPDAKYAKTAKRRIDFIEKQLRKGESFEKYAKEYSEDPGSSVKGGDMGWVQPKDMVPAFAKAALTMPLHKMSHPIRTEYGYHLVEVLGRKKVDDRMDQYKQKIAQQLYQKEYENRLKDWLQSLRTRSYVVVNTA
jgi:peptidyl-prolyl cis-trans isomerase SurA